jgi:hypothetical protein
MIDLTKGQGRGCPSAAFPVHQRGAMLGVRNATDRSVA